MDVAGQDLNELIRKTKATALRDKLIKSVLQTVHVSTDKRIFKDGLDAKGSGIGAYSAAYMKTRRKKNYPTSRKVILQATSQMVNDYKLIVLPGGDYGSGFDNPFNYDKSFWVEDTYNTEIFALTKQEEQNMEKWLEIELQKILDKL